MLKLTIPGTESWNTETETFDQTSAKTLELEHSLISLSKWEAIWEKPFLGTGEKSTEETLSYIHMMCQDPDTSIDDVQGLTHNQLAQVNTYINAKMSATWFTELPGAKKTVRKSEVITAEVLYYWIFSAEIDANVAERWHLNRLFTLLKVFNEKNAPQKKVNKNDAAAQRRMLNEQRKQQLKTSG